MGTGGHRAYGALGFCAQCLRAYVQLVSGVAVRLAGLGSTPVSHMYMQCCAVAVVAVDASMLLCGVQSFRCWHNCCATQYS